MTPEWEAEHADLHGYAEMRPELDARFEERSSSGVRTWSTARRCLGLGFRYVGVPR